ncbi:hypothetical protein F5146DRAFT_491891 [Armillaria mellea]|nr:hypothetical protein F5146DRAFT_491891 [Armillaria mellea]
MYRICKCEMRERLYQKVEETVAGYGNSPSTPVSALDAKESPPDTSQESRTPESTHRMFLSTSVVAAERARIWIARTRHLSNGDIDMLEWRGIEENGLCGAGGAAERIVVVRPRHLQVALICMNLGEEGGEGRVTVVVTDEYRVILDSPSHPSNVSHEHEYAGIGGRTGRRVTSATRKTPDVCKRPETPNKQASDSFIHKDSIGTSIFLHNQRRRLEER